MKQGRLDSLADGIFAIVMTILVLELHVPILSGIAANGSLFSSLAATLPSFAAYIVSFMLLFTYWRGHHSVASVLAENIDSKLTTINAYFFLFVGLVPFSTLLIARYYEAQAAVMFYGLNIIIIGMLLYWMREYIIASPTIRNAETTPVQLQHMTLRILVPVFTAALAVVASVIDTRLSLILFALGILFNISGSSTTLLTKMFPTIYQR